MRISDWSSDVCSSDLEDDDGHGRFASSPSGACGAPPGLRPIREGSENSARKRPNTPAIAARIHCGTPAKSRKPIWKRSMARSEEHTSELQSLMRISYAVFCLKKKNNQKSEKTYTLKVNTTTKSWYTK